MCPWKTWKSPSGTKSPRRSPRCLPRSQSPWRPLSCPPSPCLVSPGGQGSQATLLGAPRVQVRVFRMESWTQEGGGGWCERPTLSHPMYTSSVLNCGLLPRAGEPGVPDSWRSGGLGNASVTPRNCTQVPRAAGLSHAVRKSKHMRYFYGHAQTLQPFQHRQAILPMCCIVAGAGYAKATHDL